MRIDYSEPKRSFVAGQQNPRPRKEPAGIIATIVVITGITTFIFGFGTGWFFSQKAAKKSFQAATEQTSLENTPSQPPSPQEPKPTQPSATVEPVQQEQPNTAGPQTSTDAVDRPLSFYKTLPSGQKGNVLGSGINHESKGKQPLQAAIPSNLSKQPEPADVVADKNGPREKSVEKQQDNGFAVQVGSYSLRSEAETFKNKFAAKGYNAFVVESNQGDKGTWFRVRVGKKLDQDAAKELAAKLGKGAIAVPNRE